MTVTEDIRDIFFFFYDGGISAWAGNKDLLTLTVDCEYLAELIDKSFDKFYVKLSFIDKIELDPWVNQFDTQTVIKTDLHDIFKAELEILSAEIKDNVVVVTCNQHNADFDYCGGNLTISCRSIKVFDQSKNELTIGQLDKICNEYWDEWSQK
jgi:hypothetical protein